MKSLELYILEVERIEYLSLEQEQKYALLAAQGNREAKNALIEAHLQLVINIVHFFKTSKMSKEDLIQEGNYGLIHAANKYELNKGSRFSSYAALWIKQSLSRAVYNKGRMIKLPVRKEQLLHKIEDFKSDFYSDHGINPSLEDIMLFTNSTKEEILDILDTAQNLIDLGEVKPDSKYAVEEFLASSVLNPEEHFFKEESLKSYEGIFKILKNDELYIMQRRYDLDNQGKLTLKEIGKNLGVSAEAIRQTEKKCIEKLKKYILLQAV